MMEDGGAVLGLVIAGGFDSEGATAQRSGQHGWPRGRGVGHSTRAWMHLPAAAFIPVGCVAHYT